MQELADKLQSCTNCKRTSLRAQLRSRRPSWWMKPGARTYITGRTVTLATKALHDGCLLLSDAERFGTRRVMSAHLSSSTPLETFSHCVLYLHASFFCITIRAWETCSYSTLTPFHRSVCFVRLGVRLVRLGLFGQLFGGKAWSHVTFCFSSCSWIRTTSSLSARRPTGRHFLGGLLMLVTAVWWVW